MSANSCDPRFTTLRPWLCNTSQPAPQQPAESSKPSSPSLSAITTQPPDRVPTDVSARNDLAKGMYGTYRGRMFRIRL
jgi:hypothetical protein